MESAENETGLGAAILDAVVPPVLQGGVDVLVHTGPAQGCDVPTHGHLVVAGFIDFSHTGDAFAIALFIFMIGMSKIVVSRVQGVPTSVCLLMMGLVFGYIISLIYPREVYLKPEWFFNLMLPIIVFEAGFCMKNKDFFQNIGTITVYAVIGTIINIAILSVFYYYMRSFFKYDFPLPTLVLFATIICAVDPVAVLTVFDDIKVNEVLYICVFGESLLNDAVTIVLYHAVNDMQPQPLNGSLGLEEVAAGVSMAAMPSAPAMADLVALLFTFFRVCLGGILFGLVGGYATSIVSRLLVSHQMVQPIILLMIPYMTYLLTDTFHFSGLLAIIICGVISKNYTTHNIHEDIWQFTEMLLKFLVSYSESAVFVFLGISLWSDHDYDFGFIGFTLIGIFIARFIGVFVLTFFINKGRSEQGQIGLRDQFIMAYGGLRGAVCYGLVMTLDDGVIPHKKALVSTTIIVVAFTTIFQGSSIKKLVKWFQVKLSKKMNEEPDNDHKVFVMINREMQRRVINFMEDLTAFHRDNMLFYKFREFDEKYMKPKLVFEYAGHSAIVDQHKAIEMNEYAESIRCGSFAGLPHISSHAKIASSASENVLGASAAQNNGVKPTFLTVDRPSAIPRNESISGLVRNTFDTLENRQKDYARESRRSIYSRHFMDVPSPTPFDVSSDPETSFEENGYIFTYPGPQGDKKLAGDIRAYAAMRRRGLSPRRRFSTISEPRHSFSIGRPTAAPTKTRSVRDHPRFQLVVEDETRHPEPLPTARVANNRAERKVSSGGKQFTIGGTDEAYELLPITEEHEQDTSRVSHD